MHKNSKMKWDTRTIVFLGLIVAMHIVLTRLVVIDLGSYRISVGSVCTILAGLWFGPVGGGICGFLSDILGCILKGYAINPLITVAAVLWGVIPALMVPLMKGGKVRKTAVLCAAVVLTSILATLVFTTAGLVWLAGYNFYAIMPGRIAQWAIMTPIYCVLTVVLYYSPLTHMVQNATAHTETVHI
jgi:ECF transporter S component (folate family)